MTLFLLLLGALCLLAVVASIRALATDGYRRIPTRAGAPIVRRTGRRAHASRLSGIAVTWTSTARGW